MEAILIKSINGRVARHEKCANNPFNYWRNLLPLEHLCNRTDGILTLQLQGNKIYLKATNSILSKTKDCLEQTQNDFWGTNC